MNRIQVSWKAIPLLQPEGHWHVRLIQIQSGVAKSWDFTAGQYDAAATFADTCFALTFDDANNGHFFTPPATLDEGEHIFQFVNAETPAVTDEWKSKHFVWSRARRTITAIGDF